VTASGTRVQSGFLFLLFSDLTLSVWAKVPALKISISEKTATNVLQFDLFVISVLLLFEIGYH
jgi:hypothetical protein